MTPWQFLKKPEHANAILALFTFVIAVATVVYTYSTIRYTGISAKQFTATQKALQQDRRAFVTIDCTLPESVIVPNEPVVVNQKLVNKGKTPAKNVVAEVVVKLMPNDGITVPLFNYTEPHTKEIIPLVLSDVPQDEKISWMRDLQAHPVLPTQQIVDDLTAGKTYLIVYAKVTYSDIYGVEHWQHLCYWRGYTTDTLGFSSRACVDYNDVDNN